MKILFFTGYLEKKLNANNKIALELAEALVLKGHEVTVCGLSYLETGEYVNENGIKIVYLTARDFISKAKSQLEKYISSSEDTRSDAVKKFSLRHPVNAMAIAYSYSSAYNDNSFVKQIARLIEGLHVENNYDAAVAFQMPFWAEKVLMASDLSECKKCIYQLDPWGLHEIENISNESPEKRIENELVNFAVADVIFTTPVLYRQYKNNAKYSEFTDKIYEIEFPNVKQIINGNESAIKYNNSNMNVLFAGIIDDSYRNPEKFLNTIERVFSSDKNINVHFLGINNSKVLTDYAKKYPDNIFLHNPVTPDKAFAAISECDFLLNISNNISNMVPSKIFDYFSLGKPIINIQKIENCPAREYLDKYPLCFNIKEFTDEDCSQALMNFMISNRNKQIPFEQIKEIYKTSTPDYVADRITSVLSNIR